MEDVRARDQSPRAAEGRNPLKAVMRAVGIGAGAPAGEDVGMAPGEGQAQLLQEREWDRHNSKQGRRDLPVEVVESHPSLGDNGTALPTPPATAISSRTSGTDSAACETCSIARSSTASDNACATCGTNTNIAHATTTSSSSRDSYSAASAATVLQPNHPLMGLSDECGLCAAAPGALEHERQALLDKAAELERERAAHAAAAAEAEAMRARAAARAAELEVQLRSDVTSRRQQLMQQQEAASAELARLEASRASVVHRVASLEGQLGRLVDEEATLLEQRAEAERLRQEIESARDGIIARAAELAGLTSELGQQQQAASAAVAAAAAALAAREEEVEAAAQRLRMLQAQQQQAREALAAAQEAREQVSSELAAAEADLSSQQRRVDSLELKLPDLNSQHAQFMARQEQLRQQAQALSADMSAVQAEAERVAREKEETERRGAFSAERLASIDVRASQLSCQAAALQAKAAGAEGLLLAEQARAQAAEAEAHGLQTAAETLGSSKAAMMSSTAAFSSSSSAAVTTNTTSHHVNTISSRNMATAAEDADITGRDVEGLRRRRSSSSSSSGSSSSSSSGDSGVGQRNMSLTTTEGGAAVPEGAMLMCKPDGYEDSAAAGVGRSAGGVGVEGSMLRGVAVSDVGGMKMHSSSGAAEGAAGIGGGELVGELESPERDVLREFREAPGTVPTTGGVPEDSALGGAEGAVPAEAVITPAEGVITPVMGPVVVHRLEGAEGLLPMHGIGGDDGRLAREEVMGGERAPAGAGGVGQAEVGEGYAELPRPSIAAPIGGAILPTKGGFAAPKTAESEIGHAAGREGATSAATLGTLQGGLQPGYTGDAAQSPRKTGKERGGVLGNLKSMLSPKK